MEHKFEYDGVEVVVRASTIANRYTRRSVIRKLRSAYDIPNDKNMQDVVGDELADALVDYARVVSIVQSSGSAWWASPAGTPEELRAAFECYMLLGEDLIVAIEAGEEAVKPEKKVTRNGSKK